MTRKLLSAAAVMVAVFFTGSIVAQAAEVSFGGQIRPRYEVRHQSDSTGINNEFVGMRTRLNTSVKIDENTSAFLQFAMSSTWGDIANFNPSAANDTSSQVGLHQANFTLKNLFGMPLTAKIGRQEITLDGHRLIGNTGWTHGAQAHEALALSHAHDNMTALYVWSKVEEDTGATQDEANVEAHIGYLNMKGLAGENSSSSAYLIYVDADDDHPALPQTAFWTIGARHAGGMGDIDYRGEFYYQNGQTEDIDINAFMVGLRAGYKASAVSMKPKFTVWLDYLSGTDGTDPTSDIESFQTLFDTGHKFYGLQDIILREGVVGGAHNGLIDLALKLAIQPMAKTTAKVDLHAFARAEDNAAGNDDLGEEIDFTLIHKYSANTKMVVGFSYFMADTNFMADDESWFYVMADLKF